MHHKRHASVFITLLVAFTLTLSAQAAPRDEPREGIGPIERIVKIVRHFVQQVLDDSSSLSIPKP